MNEDVVFQALTTIDWDLDNLQIERIAEPEQDDPEAQAADEHQEGANPGTNDPEGTKTGAQE